MEIRQGYSYHIKDEFFDYVHTVENKPVTVHNELNRHTGCRSPVCLNYSKKAL